MGVAEDTAEAALKALNTGRYAGEADWRLVTKQKIEITDESAMLERLGRKEKMVDPDLYPKLKGARGIFKVKLANVENRLLVKKSLEGSYEKTVKAEPTDIGAYMILNALK